ncbi:hypothetical protein [Granulosicoccus antarcticus]|nr:hypothetical protein [Granulosicoccus antarcticus]
MIAIFALVYSLAMMVFSFRVSVDGWLEGVLPASLHYPLAGLLSVFG